MQFDQAGQIVRRVRWYFVEPGTEWLPVPHQFGSMNWAPQGLIGLGIGERWDSTRPWRDGAIDWPLTEPIHLCGDNSWWNDGCPSTAPDLPRTPSGRPACCAGEGGLLLGGSSTWKLGFKGSGGLLLGGSSHVIVPLHCQPYSPTHYGSATMTQQSTGGHWGQFGSGPSNIFFYDPVFGILGPSFIVCQSNAILCSGSLDGSFVVYHYTTTGYVQPMLFQSYDPTTNIGVWKMPATSPNYPGQLFNFFMLP